MRKLIVWIAGAVTLISVAAARPALLGEISVVAPLIDPHHTATPASSIAHWLHHTPLFTC